MGSPSALTPGPIRGDRSGVLLLEPNSTGVQIEVRTPQGDVVLSETHVLGAGGAKMKVQGNG